MKAKARVFFLRNAAKHGIRPIRPGQRRPLDFYLVDHITGEPVVEDRNAVLNEDAWQSALFTLRLQAIK
jgi:hypothetical protein